MVFQTESFAKAEKFEFYGNEIQIDINEKLQTYKLNNSQFSDKNIDMHLKNLHKLGLTKVFGYLKQRADSLLLDDVGYFQLVKVFTVKKFPQQSNEFRKLLAYFGLRNAGMDALLAGKANYINLFVNLNKEVDGGFQMEFNGKKYYSATSDKIPFKEMTIFHRNMFIDSAANAIQFKMNALPILGKEIATKTRTFRYGNRNFSLNTQFKKHLVDYMNDLPRFRTGVHLYAVALSSEAEKSIDDSMQMWLKNLDQNRQLEFILAMVQKAFPYKADADYLGREKRNFIEQTLADEFTDCEDKAALFCYLANKYLNKKTILIYSKKATHVTAAIELDKAAPGYNFKYKGKGYMICEGACVGYKMGETILKEEEIAKAEIFE
ncbi:MAG: hypothetical protein IT244_03875 [Bacteroidia bacterium]|nr:hypothetical protein [Bacteroidia bacterium]